MKRKTSRRRKKDTTTKPLNEIFSEEWKQGVRKFVAERKNSGDSWDQSFADLSEAAIARKILGDIALEYAPKELFGKIVADAEKVCNEIGISLIPEGATVDRCVTKTHKECTGKYVSSNPDLKRTITCNCPCHSDKKAS